MFNCIIDPACQNISTELQCYVLDRNCTAHSDTEETSGQNDVIYTVSILGCLIVLIICCIIIIRCYKRRRTYSNKSKFNNMNDLFYLIYFQFIIYDFCTPDINKATNLYLISISSPFIYFLTSTSLLYFPEHFCAFISKCAWKRIQRMRQ